MQEVSGKRVLESSGVQLADTIFKDTFEQKFAELGKDFNELKRLKVLYGKSNELDKKTALEELFDDTKDNSASSGFEERQYMLKFPSSTITQEYPIIPSPVTSI